MIQTAHYESNDYINILIPEVDDALNNYLSFKNLDNKHLSFGSNSVFVTKQFATKHGITIGQSISLEFQGITQNI